LRQKYASPELKENEYAGLIRPESTEAPLVKLLVRLLVEGSRQYGRRT
jgi:hypothetical protein